METNEESAVVHHIPVTRTARYATLGGGSGGGSAGVRDVWIVCHGYAQLAARFIERFRCIASPNRLIVAPEALSRFYADRGTGFHGPSSQVGATWMTAEDRDTEIRDYVAYLDAVHDEIFARVPRSSVALTVLGFSQGTATVSRWLGAGHARADQVILWAGSLPAEMTREEASRLNVSAAPTLLVAGRDDAFITAKILEQQVGVLKSFGVIAEVVQFAGGHEIDGPTLKAIAESGAG
jgi:Predicted esterase